MRTLVAYMPALACGATMLLICVPMLLRRRHDQSADQSASRQEVAELREEISRLKAERALEDRTEAFDG